jgi:hypothetical protein
MAVAMLSRPPAIPSVPADVTNARTTTVRHASAINAILRGGISATIGVTLAANATTSVVQDSRIGPYTFVGLMPASAHAVNALPSIWIETTKGAATIHHGLSPNLDQTYVALLIG